MSMPTARITSEHVAAGTFRGQSVRAVGKLLAIDEQSVQMQLAGEGTARATPAAPARPFEQPPPAAATACPCTVHWAQEPHPFFACESSIMALLLLLRRRAGDGAVP